jgi:chemotaxis protein MotB
MLPIKRSHLLLPLLLGGALLLPGCHLKMRELKTENQMLQAKVMQLQQDLSVAKEDSSALRSKELELRKETELAQSRARDLDIQLETSKAKLDASQLALTSSMDSRAKQFADRMQAGLEREQELKQKIEELETRISTIGVERLSDEQKMAELQSALDAATADAEAARKSIEDAKAESQQLTAQLTTRDEELGKLKTEQSTLQTQLEETQKRLEQLTSDLRLARDEAEAKEKERSALASELTTTKAAAEKSAAEAKEAATAKGPGMASSAAVEKARSVAVEKLARQIDAKSADVIAADGAVRVILYSDELFRPATTLLSDAGLKALGAVEETLGSVNARRIIVQGHTDDVPVRNMPYPDNWELAAARATEVVRWLAARPNVSTDKIVAQSHSFYGPIADNKSANGRRQNRRVEIVLELDPAQ